MFFQPSAFPFRLYCMPSLSIFSAFLNSPVYWNLFALFNGKPYSPIPLSCFYPSTFKDYHVRVLAAFPPPPTPIPPQYFPVICIYLCILYRYPTRRAPHFPIPHIFQFPLDMRCLQQDTHIDQLLFYILPCHAPHMTFSFSSLYPFSTGRICVQKKSPKVITPGCSIRETTLLLCITSREFLNQPKS